MAASTGFADLDDVLDELVASVRAVLGSTFCGAYLQGSFALGEADEHSDVDFVVVTEDEVTERQLDALQAMHRRVHALPSRWAQHLEGSYIPRQVLRQVDPSRRKLPFLDNGADALVPDAHCNTAVVRWILRERGVTLDGPDPSALIAPIAASSLRAEGLAMLRDIAAWAHEPADGAMSAWKQPYLVLSVCRILFTWEHGEIASKRRAGEWALGSLDPAWRQLIRRALDDRPDPWGRVHRMAEPGIAERTVAFVDEALNDAPRRLAQAEG